MESQFKILLIDPKNQDKKTVQKNLPELQFKVQSAQNFDQIKEYLKNDIPDLLLLSAELPKIDPFKACERFSRAGIGVILLSGEITHTMVIKAYRFGAVDLLVRPLKPGIIHQRIERALGRIGKRPSEKKALTIDFGTASEARDRVDILIEKIDELLALPFAVTKIIRLCNDPKTNALNLEKPAQSDPAIGAMIMRRANSAAYGGAQKITSIQMAVVRLGMKTTRNIATSLSVFKLFSKEEKSFGFNRLWFWVHALSTGICAQTLTLFFKKDFSEDAFMAGLLHDIGKMVLDDYMNEDYQKAIRKAHMESLPVRIAEESIFETQHPYVGASVTEHWGFPAPVVEVISEHHRHEKLAKASGDLSLGTIVAMANHMAKALQAGSGGDFLVERAASALWGLLPENMPWKKLIEKVLEELKEHMETLEVPPEHFQIEIPKQERGKAGIFAPSSPNYGHLLQIALMRMGLQTLLFSSIDERIKKEDFTLIVGDFTPMEDDQDIARYKEDLAGLADKNVFLPGSDERNKNLDLDFFWFESKVNEMLEGEKGESSKPVSSDSQG